MNPEASYLLDKLYSLIEEDINIGFEAIKGIVHHLAKNNEASQFSLYARVVELFADYFNTKISRLKEKSSDFECAAAVTLGKIRKKEDIEIAKDKIKPWRYEGCLNWDWLFKEDK